MPNKIRTKCPYINNCSQAYFFHYPWFLSIILNFVAGGKSDFSEGWVNDPGTTTWHLFVFEDK